MQVSRRVLIYVCQFRTASAVSDPTLCWKQIRWQCTSKCTQESVDNLHDGESVVSGEKSRPRRKRRRAVHDESIFAKCGLPLFEETARDELEKQLASSKVYDRGGVIALSKPAGLPVTGQGPDRLSVVEVLPSLAESIGKPAAEIAKAADSDSSGLVILGENKKIAKSLHDAFIKAGRSNQLIRKYWALTIGVPSPTEGTIDLPISAKTFGDQTLMVPNRCPTKGDFERKDALRCRTEYRVLSANPDLNCSLLELKPVKLRKHQFQVHLSDKLCCIIGDRMYSNRIQDVLGVPVLVEPSQATIGTQRIPESIQEALGCRAWHLSRLPLFLHWYQATLPKWQRGGGACTITAPPPGYFVEALHRLSLYNETVKANIEKTSTTYIAGGR